MEKKISKVFDPQSKAKEVMDSKMSDSEKKRYLIHLGVENEGELAEKVVSFGVYAVIKKIPAHLQSAMKAYPKAKGIETASVKQWEEIFKSF